MQSLPVYLAVHHILSAVPTCISCRASHTRSCPCLYILPYITYSKLSLPVYLAVHHILEAVCSAGPGVQGAPVTLVGKPVLPEQKRLLLNQSVSDPDGSGFFADPDPGLKSPDPDPSINKLMGSK